VLLDTVKKARQNSGVTARTCHCKDALEQALVLLVQVLILQTRTPTYVTPPLNQLGKTALDRARTDRVSLTYDLDPDLQSSVSCGHDLFMSKGLRSTVSRFRRYSRNKRTDGQTDGCDCITSRANAIGNCICTSSRFMHSLQVIQLVFILTT